MSMTKTHAKLHRVERGNTSAMHQTPLNATAGSLNIVYRRHFNVILEIYWIKYGVRKFKLNVGFK